MARTLSFALLALVLFGALLASPGTSASASSSNSPSLYEVLELKPSCSKSDIKKAYRRLALKHHPDRNNGSPESTEKFAAIAEAYETLSDDQARREYDHARRSNNHQTPRQRQSRGRSRSSNAHAMFNDLFTNDPFFSEAFKEMDDLFAQTFSDVMSSKKNSRRNNNDNQRQQPKSWFVWLLSDVLGLNFQLSTTYQGSDGSFHTSNYASAKNGLNRRSVSKSSKIIIENGRRVEIKELTKDGNSIREKYVEGKLKERWINGEPSEVEGVEKLTSGRDKNRKKKNVEF
mmetsp:Transcript_14356/g.26423  ORF Transcript_14356/g.26423 Transcript_14356/m.26423 type:complete len:288 (+) Transcript_14356:90-953(+)